MFLKGQLFTKVLHENIRNGKQSSSEMWNDAVRLKNSVLKY